MVREEETAPQLTPIMPQSRDCRSSDATLPADPGAGSGVTTAGLSPDHLVNSDLLFTLNPRKFRLHPKLRLRKPAVDHLLTNGVALHMSCHTSVTGAGVRPRARGPSSRPNGPLPKPDELLVLFEIGKCTPWRLWSRVAVDGDVEVVDSGWLKRCVTMYVMKVKRSGSSVFAISVFVFVSIF